MHILFPHLLQNLPIACFLVFALTLMAGVIPIIRNWHETHLHHFVSFSAGVLIATAFLHMLPAAWQAGSPQWVGVNILIGFIIFFILEKFVMIHACEEHHCDYHRIGMSALVGIGTHSVFDGFFLGASFLVPSLAPAVWFAIVIHKMPAAFALSTLLHSAKWPKKKIVFLLIGFSLIIPVSAVLSRFVLAQFISDQLHSLMGIVAGSFLYIATSDFLPETHRREGRKFKTLIAFLFGVLFVAALEFFGPHHH